MIPWKRTLAWALCALVSSVAAVADEPPAEPAAPATESAVAPASDDPMEAAVDGDAVAPGLAEPAAAPADAMPGDEAADAMAAGGPEAMPAAPADATPADATTAEGGDAMPAAPADAMPGEAADAMAAGGPEAMPAAPADATPADATPAAAPTEAAGAEQTPTLTTAAGPPLGAIGYDSQGHQGRIHIVVKGDTLWDISDAYLGTPWVWPSIWKDNGQVKNPHLIYPGDHIWITPTEMRRVTPQEAETLLSNAPPETPAAAAPEQPAPVEETPNPYESAVAPSEANTYRVSARESAGLITPEQMTSSASIVSAVPDRVLLSQEDQVYIGLGEAEVQPGDEFTVFRTDKKVFDPDTGRLLGYHVDILGWVRVEETHPETSLASIRMSTAEIEKGDRVMPREPLPPVIDIQSAPVGVEGRISYFPGRRVLMGFQDFVYLNRGSLDGLEVGSPLEVYRPGFGAFETARQEQVEVPDRVVAKLLVVRAETDSAVAVVTATDDELEVGDHFRGATE